MSVIITYLNDDAQTPLGRFVIQPTSYKYSDKSNRWSLGLSLSVGGLIKRCRCRSIVGDIYFSKSTVVHTKKWFT